VDPKPKKKSNVCMYVLNENTTHCREKNSTARFFNWVSLFEFKSTFTEASFVVVGGLVGHFKACVRIAADFPQQWPQSDLLRSAPLLEIVAVLFVNRVLVVCQAKASHPV